MPGLPDADLVLGLLAQPYRRQRTLEPEARAVRFGLLFDQDLLPAVAPSRRNTPHRGRGTGLHAEFLFAHADEPQGITDRVVYRPDADIYRLDLVRAFRRTVQRRGDTGGLRLGAAGGSHQTRRVRVVDAAHHQPHSLCGYQPVHAGDPDPAGGQPDPHRRRPLVPARRGWHFATSQGMLAALRASGL